MNNNFDTSEFSQSMNTSEKIHYLGDLRIIGQIVNQLSDKEPIGYVVMTEKTQKFKMYTVEQTMSLLNRFKFVNAAIENGKIVNTECSMTRMPKFNTSMQVIGNFGVIILGEIIDGKGTLGYRAIDTNAKIVDIRENDVIALSTKGIDIINAKIVDRGNKKIVSGIKSEFTKIEKSSLTRETAKKKNTAADNWRHKKHVDKYISYLLPKTLKYIYGANPSAFNDFLYSRMNVDDYTYSYVDFNREANILIKEVYKKENGFSLSKKDSELLKRLAIEVPHTDYIGYDKSGKYINFNRDEQYYYFSCLAQFALYNPDVRKTFLTKKVIRKFNKNGIYNTMVQNGHASDILLKTTKELEGKIKEYNIAHPADPHDKHPERRFTTRTFTRAEDIAQLGFAVVEQNRGYKFTTKTGLTKKLNYIGDFLKQNSIYNPSYESYKKLARCLGDILIVADLNKLMNKCVESINNNDNRYMTYDRFLGYMEMLIAIAYIYSSEAVRKFVNDYESDLNNIGVIIPDYEELSSTDYKLSPELNMYYASGFNVFLRDNAKYYYKYLSEAELINYRQLGVKHNIQHEMLQGELASIVNMVTSEACPAEFIEENIGKLRFF